MFKLRARPYKLLLELNSICNSKCKTCHIWVPQKSGPPPAEIQLSEIENYLKSFGKDLLWIALSGGEPTLFTAKKELFALIRQHCPSLRILTFTTNALQPQVALELALEVKETSPDHFITVSLDGDEKTHDYVRGIKGNFAKALETYELLKSHRLHVHFGITSSTFNAEFIQTRYVHWAEKIKAISFAHSGGIYKKDNDLSSPDLGLNLDALIRHYRIKDLGQVLEYLYLKLARRFFETRQLPLPCTVISSSLHIRPNGDIHPCMFLPKLGNIRDSDLNLFLSTEKTAALKEKARKGDCQRCWMNCYAPHSIMRHPLKAVLQLLWPRKHV